MYLPKHFSPSPQQIDLLIEQNSFMTVLSFPDKKPFVNHLPLIFKPGDRQTLIGHMSRANPQWRHFQKTPEALAIVSGPHTYITPRWYKSGRDVPTWNYAVAHLTGSIELKEKFDDQVEILQHLTQHFEGAGGWEFELPDDLLEPAALTGAIVSFEFHIEKIESKFKLSQNRSSIDRNGVLAGLSERTDDLSRAVRELMLESEKNLS